MEKSFIHHNRAWYSDYSPRNQWYDEVYINIGVSGEVGEIFFHWYNFASTSTNKTAIKMELFDESFGHLEEIKDVIDYIRNKDELTPHEFCKELEKMGYENKTPYEK
jgi:hypothetical protein